jgi:hypothetical protein
MHGITTINPITQGALRLGAIIGILFVMSGCASFQDKIDNFWLARWDPTEARYVAALKVQAQDLFYICDTSRFTKEERVTAIGEVNTEANRFLAYSETLPDDNRPVIRVAKNIQDSSKEFYNRALKPKMSKLYCENKASFIINMAHQAQRVIQKKRLPGQTF